jgi:hypothetical protein
MNAGKLATKLPILVTFVTLGLLMFVNTMSKRVRQVVGRIYCLKVSYIFFLHIFILTHDFHYLKSTNKVINVPRQMQLSRKSAVGYWLRAECLCFGTKTFQKLISRENTVRMSAVFSWIIIRSNRGFCADGDDHLVQCVPKCFALFSYEK